MQAQKITPSEAFLKFQRERIGEDIVYNRNGQTFKMRIQVLTQKENANCKLEAIRYFKAKGLDHNDLGSAYSDRVACEVLFIACRDPEPATINDTGKEVYYRFFPSADALEEELTPDELAQLFELYKLTQYRLGNWDKQIRSKEDVDEWINRLATGALEVDFLVRQDWPQLAELTVQLARRLHTILIQQSDSDYISRFPPLISVPGITSFTGDALKPSEENDFIAFGETSYGSSAHFVEVAEAKTLVPRYVPNSIEPEAQPSAELATPEEIKSLAESLRK